MSRKKHTLRDLTLRIREFVKDRDWESFQKPLSLAISASIEMGELMELFQWRDEENINEILYTSEFREALGEEIADVMIYLLRLADVTDLDLANAILAKLEKNSEKYPAEEWKGRAPHRIK